MSVSNITQRDQLVTAAPKVRHGSTIAASDRPWQRPGRRIGRLGIDVVPLVLFIDIAALLTAGTIIPLGRTAAGGLALCVLALNAGGGHYRARIAPSLLDELPGLAARALIGGALLLAFRLVVWGQEVHNLPVLAALLFIPLAALGRAVGYAVIRRNRVSGRLSEPTLIVGCGHIGMQLATALREHPEYGLNPIGFVDDEPLIPIEDRHVPLVGPTSELTNLLVDHRVRNVIFAFTNSRESVLVDLVRACDRMACEVFFVPRLFELCATGRDTELIWGLPMTRLRRASYRTISWHAKRVFDTVAATAGLLLASPIMLACAVAVRMEGGPHVIFRQERVGLDGRSFEIFKFRSLQPSSADESAQRWNISHDERLGPVGRLMRRLSLDELPQLWNVVRGDMSLVGPRPERPLFVDQFRQQFPRYMARHRVPAGLTGWAQVNGLRGDTDIADRASFDNYYIENWSLWADIKILVRTAGQVFGGRGG